MSQGVSLFFVFIIFHFLLRMFKYNIFSFYLAIPIPTSSRPLIPQTSPTTPSHPLLKKVRLTTGSQQSLILLLEARPRPSLNIYAEQLFMQKECATRLHFQY